MNSYEIRDPVHGFISFNDWERDVINHPVFQRMRKIRQLAWTDMVYPGAMHTRFEHSLGVMHIATLMFDQIVKRRYDYLCSELSYTESGLERDRVLLRMASLLHDVGHAPFSHSGEGLMPQDDESLKTYKHENYSAAAIRFLMNDVIEQHPLNQNYKIKATEIADFLDGRVTVGRALLWRCLLSGQLDADRCDYLLRDSLHAGVTYGNYDLGRVLSCVSIGTNPETDQTEIVITSGGVHAAEGLIIARYMMFTQVYFQHTRRAYDHHIANAIKVIMKAAAINSDDVSTTFPPPTTFENITKYLEWNDWRVLGKIDSCEAGTDGDIIKNRKHIRSVYETSDSPNMDELQFMDTVQKSLGEMVAFIDKASASWYKTGKDDVWIMDRYDKLAQLSSMSSVVNGLKPNNMYRIYVSIENQKNANQIVRDMYTNRTNYI
ncbi:MAG: HD domain-containing protein [Armatimonadota bacterium]